MVELVGILNITPDSFSDGGRWSSVEAAAARAHELCSDGAAVIDIGAESTRPGARPLGSDEEWARLAPVLSRLAESDVQISIDSRHPETIRRCLEVRDDIIVNDVTGLESSDMQTIVAASKLRCIVSHLPSSAAGNIQAAHKGALLDSEQQVLDELMVRVRQLGERGISQAQIILDPGLGFGKTPELNQRLLSFARLVPEYDVMIGYSRKRFLGRGHLELAPNLEAGRVAAAAGARYLRVHDVAGHHSLID